MRVNPYLCPQMKAMKILLTGSGGREHALALKLAASPLCEKLFIAPGNPGTASLGENVPVSATDFAGLEAVVRREGISLIVPGPEAPLAAGMADYFQSIGIPVAGPSQRAAQLESSKDFAKQFMVKHGVPTAAYRSFHKGQEAEAMAWIEAHPLPVVVKASGLAAGKGVVICTTREEATAVAREMLSGAAFGESGSTIVVEQFLTGIEVSVFVITDGKEWVLLPEAKDYKRVGEGDTGPNTGGMGAVSPVPFANEAFMQKVIRKVIEPTIRGIQAEGLPYAGFVFFGIIKVDEEPWVIEYNVRMGDPETEVVMPRLESDLVQLLHDAARGCLKHERVKVKPSACVTVMMVSGGYPGAYETGKPITGLENAGELQVFHAGTQSKEGRLLTAGGRVMAVTALDQTISAAVAKCLAGADRIQFEGKYYRRDIGGDLLT